MPEAEIFAGQQSLDEQAYRQLRQALVEGVFIPGERLSIRRIATALGTSTMPARTALRRLASEQALDLMPSGTAIVPRLTRKAFEELSAMRIALETLALQLASPLMDKARIKALPPLIAAGRKARMNGDAEAFLRADRSFLFAIYQASSAPMLQGVIEALWLRRGPMFWEARWVLMGRSGATDHHDEILSALTRHDVVQAASELRQEIESVRDLLLQEMQFAGDVQTKQLPAIRTTR